MIKTVTEFPLSVILAANFITRQNTTINRSSSRQGCNSITQFHVTNFLGSKQRRWDLEPMECRDIKILLERSVTWTLLVLAGCLLKYSEWDLRKVFWSHSGLGGGGERSGTGLLLLSLFSLLTSLSPGPLLPDTLENPGQDLFFILSIIIQYSLYIFRCPERRLSLPQEISLVTDNGLVVHCTALLCTAQLCTGWRVEQDWDSERVTEPKSGREASGLW